MDLCFFYYRDFYLSDVWDVYGVCEVERFIFRMMLNLFKKYIGLKEN